MSLTFYSAMKIQWLWVFFGFLGEKTTALFSPPYKREKGITFPHFTSLYLTIKKVVRGAQLPKFVKCLESLLSLESFFFLVIKMGRFASLVSMPEVRDAFKTKYNIPAKVEIKHCHLGEWYTKRPPKAVVIPMIAFIEGGMQILMHG